MDSLVDGSLRVVLIPIGRWRVGRERFEGLVTSEGAVTIEDKGLS